MKRQPESEQVQRLTVKTVDQVFIARALEGLGCSLFEAEAPTELVKEVYFPWLLEPTAIPAGQLAMIAVSAGKTLRATLRNFIDLGRTVTHKRIICRKAYLEGKPSQRPARLIAAARDGANGPRRCLGRAGRQHVLLVFPVQMATYIVFIAAASANLRIGPEAGAGRVVSHHTLSLGGAATILGQGSAGSPASSGNVNSWQGAHIRAASSLAQAFWPQLGQVNFVLLARFLAAFSNAAHQRLPVPILLGQCHTQAFIPNAIRRKRTRRMMNS